MILDSLKWRYATKKFDPSKKLSDQDLQILIDAVNLTPTSFGLFPFKLLIISDPEIRKSLVPHAWGQTQVAEASHLFVFARRTDIDATYVHRFIERVAEVRGTDIVSLKGYEDMMTGFANNLDSEKLANWAAKQAYIALGSLMTIAAEMRIDTCPMEGYVPVEFDRILGLAEKNLASVVLCPVGYRSEDDKYALAPKVRFEEKDVVIKI